jgi:voltage-gated potassium channel
MQKQNRLATATDTLKEVLMIYSFMLFGVACLFCYFESISLADSIYWAGITATSTGYGDISPKTDVGKAIAFLWAHIAIFAIAPLIIVRYMVKIIDQRDNFTHEEQLHLIDINERILKILENNKASKYEKEL